MAIFVLCIIFFIILLLNLLLSLFTNIYTGFFYIDIIFAPCGIKFYHISFVKMNLEEERKMNITSYPFYTISD